MNTITISYISGDPLGLRKYEVTEDGEVMATFEADVAKGKELVFDEAKKAYVKARYDAIVKELPF